MTSRFRTQIRQSLADQNLQTALDANAERRIIVRQQAFASLPDSQAMRIRAKAVRTDTVSNLDHYLDQFISHLQRHHIQVHRAADAAQAVQIILEIARQTGARLIAKSKTMVSEEIALNHALEAAGLRVVETDLGEYIVQIRHEPPSHIITPAVHLRREDVGRTFHEVLGIPYTDDIPTMTAAARRVLRDVFLTADLGISGVNFGVAETGTLCVVTNEGNGRMVTTLPRVHVALMGMERVVPTLADLGLMLRLLPRSATGQKLSVYTSLIHAPRGHQDQDGPHERHVILLDNGRSRTLHSPLSEILNCIRCGACLNACPVFREIGGYAYIGKSGSHSPYPGPMGSVLSPAFFGQGDFGHLARASTLCGACKEACPVDIDLPRLLLRIRAGNVGSDQAPKDHRGQPAVLPSPIPNTPSGLAMGLRAFTWAAVSPQRYAMVQKLAGMLGWLGKRVVPGRGESAGAWLRLPAITGWGLGKDFPAPPMRTFRQRWESHRADTQTVARDIEKPEPKFEPGTAGDLAAPNRLSSFSTELEALGGHVIVCHESELAAHILRLVSAQPTSKIMAWAADQLPAGLIDSLSAAGVDVTYPTGETILECQHITLGLTGAAAGIADTGTLLLTSGEGRPLTASLLPEVHLAVLHEADLCDTLSDALALPVLRDASAAVLISGPSRTADIEMTLTIGVHGPGELHVFCISENA